MANHKSPLRDRLLSNSPDPIKSSILRESGMGWNSQSSGSLSSSSSGGSITSPLRISKRDSPGRPRGPAIARRSSSSYKHVHNNNLVSKSPFKSQIPTPSTSSNRPISITFPTSSPTRRVSGEKRPRPSSLYEQAENENERPFALKRERRQSKGFQNLIEKEPVTKSPFKLRQRTSSGSRPSTSPIPVPLTRAPLATFTPSATSIQPPTSLIALPPPAISPGPSPGRSSLVSKRMHGPRLSGSGKRERRKTVTFDERCDVVEFDREEETDEEALEMNEDDNAQDDADDPFFQATGHSEDHAHEEVMDQNESYESIQLSDTGSPSAIPSLMALDPDTSITGLVEEIFFSPNARNFLPDSSFASNASTPPRYSDIPTDLDTEDGVPFGRSHHVERFIQHHHQQPSQTQQPPGFSPHDSPRHPLSLQRNHAPGSYPFSFNLPTHASPHGPPATPPRRSPGMQSTPPLGRSTHFERIKQAREEEKEEDADDVNQLPLSPSPMKRPSRDIAQEEGLVPRLTILNEAQAESSYNSTADGGADPFQQSSLQEESPLEIHGDESVGSVNVSIGNSQVSFVSLGGTDIGAEAEGDSFNSTEDSHRYEETADVGEDEQERSPLHPTFQSPVLARVASPIGRLSSPVGRISSPIGRVISPLLTGDQSPSMGGRPRINKEEVRRRLLGRRSVGSSSPELGSPSPREEKSPECEASQLASDVNAQVDVNSERLRVEYEEEDRERDRMSVMTGQTDFSTETAIVEQAERRNVLASVTGQDRVNEREFGFLSTGERLQFDFGSKFGLGGLGISNGGNAGSDDNLDVTPVSARTRADSVSSRSVGSSEMKMGNVDVDMEMKSALDRLMEDVASGRVDDSMMTDECDDSYDESQDSPIAGLSRPTIMERVATDTPLLHNSTVAGISSRTVSDSSVVTIPPQVPPKDNIKQREQMILERRREARRITEEEEEAFRAPSKAKAPVKDQQHLGVGRPGRRRSMSTGDLLDVHNVAEDDPLADSIEKELSKLVEQPKKSKYHIRERGAMIYASSSEDKISHMAGPGDVDAGKAWRAVRRPSDMNEYSKQIKEYRAKENLGKAYGKVFVKVLGVKGVHLPLPDQATTITCTLNNGIHFVTTPECQLSQECRIDQEFELIEHSKLEFTLTIKVRRDPHIISQFKALAPAPPPPAPVPPPVVQTASRSSGMRSFFSSSPKKSKEKVAQPPPLAPATTSQPLQRLPENLARYLKPDGTLARAFISFKDIAARCDTRLFETSYPLIGQRVELGGKFSTLQVGEILLQMFRLPPLPGIPPDQLPQSLDDCHRGLRHINWHKVTYFQGTLTQSGGDCSTWRRRHLRVVGANLVAFNDVTKKATATIDLKKAIAVEDDQEARKNALNSSARSNPRSSRYADEYDGLYGVERSFRLIFPHDEEIIFFADTDEEKARWLEVLRALVGRIPPHPLWAELLWQRHEEITKRNQAAQQTIPPSSR